MGHCRKRHEAASLELSKKKDGQGYLLQQVSVHISELHVCFHVCEAVAPAKLEGAKENPEEVPAHSLEYPWKRGRGGSVA